MSEENKEIIEFNEKKTGKLFNWKFENNLHKFFFFVMLLILIFSTTVIIMFFKYIPYDESSRVILRHHLIYNILAAIFYVSIMHLILLRRTKKVFYIFNLLASLIILMNFYINKNTFYKHINIWLIEGKFPKSEIPRELIPYDVFIPMVYSVYFSLFVFSLSSIFISFVNNYYFKQIEFNKYSFLISLIMFIFCTFALYGPFITIWFIIDNINSFIF